MGPANATSPTRAGSSADHARTSTGASREPSSSGASGSPADETVAVPCTMGDCARKTGPVPAGFGYLGRRSMPFQVNTVRGKLTILVASTLGVVLVVLLLL